MHSFLNENQIITKINVAIFVPAGSGAAIHKNRRFHGLALNCGGEKQYIFDDGTTFSVKENDLIYLPKYSNYEVKLISPGDTYCINFQCQSEETFPPFTFHLSNAADVLQAYQNAEKVWKRAKSYREYIVLSELYKILYIIQRKQDTPYFPKTKQNLIKPAIDYIHKNYTEELINMHHLSELCGMSYEYFRRLFHQFYGCSPIKYINDLKLSRAKELLSSRLYSVSEAGLLSGFSDFSHFSRFFKKNTGVTPSEYIFTGK
jgi:AraC-like DNA-binding protein